MEAERKSAEYIPVLVGACPFTIRAVNQYYGNDIHEGGIFLVNAPCTLDGECTQSRLDELTRETVRKYQAILGGDMDVGVEIADHIPVTRAGKRKLVISKLPKMGEQDSGLEAV